MAKTLKTMLKSFFTLILSTSLINPTTMVSSQVNNPASDLLFINLFKKSNKSINKELEEYGYASLSDDDLRKIVASFSWDTDTNYEYVDIAGFKKNDAIKISDFVKMSEEERYKTAKSDNKSPSLTLIIIDKSTGQNSYLEIAPILSQDTVRKINEGEYLNHSLVSNYLIELINDERIKNDPQLEKLTINPALTTGTKVRADELASNGSLAYKNEQNEQMYYVRNASGISSYDVFSQVDAKDRIGLVELDYMSYPYHHINNPYQYLSEKFIAEAIFEDIKTDEVIYSQDYGHINYSLAVCDYYNLYQDDPEITDPNSKLYDQPITHVLFLSQTSQIEVPEIDISDPTQVAQTINQQIISSQNAKTKKNEVVIEDKDQKEVIEECEINVVFESKEGLLESDKLDENPEDFKKWLKGLYASSCTSLSLYESWDGELISNIGYQLNDDTYLNSFSFILSHSTNQQEELNAFADEVRLQTKDLSDTEKARYIYNKVIDMSEYDEGVLIKYHYNNADNNIEPYEDSTLDGKLSSISVHSPYSILSTGRGVCQAYAGLFQLLAEYCGLESRYVTGYAHEDGVDHIDYSDYGHAWNEVKIDGTWYSIDPTWGDIMIEESNYLSHEEQNTIRDQFFMKDLSSTHLKD